MAAIIISSGCVAHTVACKTLNAQVEEKRKMKALEKEADRLEGTEVTTHLGITSTRRPGS
jgi:hypothetical protein